MSVPGEETLAEENRRLRQENAALQTQAQAWQSQVRELEDIRRHLEHTVAVCQRCLFGSRSEKIDPKELEARIAQAAAEAREQLAQEKRPGEPPPEAEEEKPAEKAGTPSGPTAAEEEKRKRKARPHGRGAFPAHLPRRRIEHPVDPAQSVCACCADHPPLTQVGEDTCEKLVKLPVQYEVHVHVYPQMACQRCHEGVTSAPRQDNRLKADGSVIADVVVKKYVEHQPLYRQQQAFERLHLPITRQTLCDWKAWCGDQVAPVVRAMAEYICARPLVQSDETSVRMQLADGQMETARLWAYGLPWAEVVFDFRTDKSQKGPREFLEGAKARFIQADGGSSYGPVFKALELLHVACMAHIRRGLFEARAEAPLAVDLLLAAIQKLYRIENRAKAAGLSLEARLELRQREARPVFLDVGQLIATMRRDVLPKSPLGQALGSAENQWPAMARYLEVVHAELDNNSTEHALRGVVLGRRNWLHVGQEAGGEKAATLFSLMITCKRLGVEPYAYLHDILQRLPGHPNKDIWQLTPRGWKETFAPKSPPPRSQRLNPSDARLLSASSLTPCSCPPHRAPTRFRRTVTPELQREGVGPPSRRWFWRARRPCRHRQSWRPFLGGSWRSTSIREKATLSPSLSQTLILLPPVDALGDLPADQRVKQDRAVLIGQFVEDPLHRRGAFSVRNGRKAALLAGAEASGGVRSTVIISVD